MRDKREFEQLTDEKRWKLHELRGQGYSMRECGRRLGVHVSTVSRELAEKSAEVAGGRVYLPDHAILITKGRRSKCHPHIKMNDPAFRKTIVIEIQKGRSPEIIAGRLKREHGRTVISHETLYDFIYDSEIGKRGDDVQGLQEFLNTEGYLSTTATGYFGPMTANAVARWQASQGVSAVGSMGPMSRERIRIWCGGGNTGCTKEYAPVCGSKPIVCITTPCNPIQQTYGNRCLMSADGATFAYEGACRDATRSPSADPQCKKWTDGKYCGETCERPSPGSTLIGCAIPMCLAPNAGTPPDRAPYCIEYFGNMGNKPPVISGLSGPTTLTLNEQGTWKIDASDPENGNLSYSVTWGDEWLMMGAPRTSSADYSIVQSTTFTHSYSNAGTYTVRVVVRDSAGAEAQTSMTVTVQRGLVACTMQYDPVCGQPPEPACRRSIPACMMATPGPQTYGNRCVMNAADATFLYSGECARINQ